MRSLLPAVVICLLVGFSGAFAETPAAPNKPDNDTVLLWHLDDGGGNAATDAAMGGKLAGKIIGAEWVDGRFGKALKWGADNGNVQVRGDFSAIRDAFTLQAWVYLERLPTGQPPFWASDVVGKLKSFVITVRPPGVLYVGVQLGEQPNWLTGQTPIPVQRWTHVALVYDGAAGKIGTFVDGKLDAEFDLPPGLPRTVNHADQAFFIRSYAGGDEKLVGMIDEVCLSSRAHTFGHRWRRPVYLHALRYSSAFLLGLGQTAQGANPTHSVALSIEDAERRPVLTKRLTAQEAASGAVIPAPGLAAGQYRATVTLTSADGATETALDRVFRYTPPQARLIDIRPDGVCVAQGKPFFPLGLYHVAQKDLKAVAEAGFNVAFAFATTLGPNWPAKNDGVGYIEKCGEHGLMGVGLGGALHKPDIGQTTLTHYQSNPNLLMWYVADEPSGPGGTTDAMLRRYEQWAEWDPSHPLFLLHNRPPEFLRYAQACDIFATDPYPIRSGDDPPLEQVARFTETAVGAVFGRKPVWVALQCYTVKAVSDKGKGLDGIPRLPTAEELRCMSYLALASGARGLLYYAFDDTYYNNGSIRGVHLASEFPEFWDEMTACIGELARHRPLWTAPYADLRPENQSPPVVVQKRPYLHDGRAHVLAVNPTRRGQPVRVRIPGAKGPVPVQDALGGSPAALANELLTDTLAPRQAKCYVIPQR